MIKPKTKRRRKPKLKLYEINALVSYSTVILAASEKDAMAHVKTWEQAWAEPSNADLIGVVDVELTDIRPLKASDWDEAHDRSSATCAMNPKRKISRRASSAKRTAGSLKRVRWHCENCNRRGTVNVERDEQLHRMCSDIFDAHNANWHCMCPESAMHVSL